MSPPTGQPANGFPIVIPVAVSEDRIPTLLSVLHDGVYLNKRLTKTLTMQLATFNPELNVFASFSVLFSWEGGGLVTGSFKLGALMYKKPYMLGRTDLQVLA